MSAYRSGPTSTNGVAPSLAAMLATESDDNYESSRLSNRESPASEVPNDEDERVHPRAGGRLVVPREEVGDDYSAGDELDLTTCLAAKIQKPSRHEWIRLFRDLELPTKLLIRKPTSDSMDEQYFYVAPKLRRDIEGDLKSVRVFPYYSLSARRWGLWVVKVTAGNSWYESLQALFTQDASFFKTRQIRVFSDKVKSAQYQVKHKELDRPVDDPPQPTSDLLGQALGDDHFIVDRQHPVYLSLVEGEELR